MDLGTEVNAFDIDFHLHAWGGNSPFDTLTLFRKVSSGFYKKIALTWNSFSTTLICFLSIKNIITWSPE
ncbi:hypothetical protein LCGC14_1495210 [marine sediment metagenome]|uniref:Uncharacterized protein n=1 Tax=marine sediment metagenome TaxID=412755 RepID=A0A0F9LL53_9ZZZZ